MRKFVCLLGLLAAFGPSDAFCARRPVHARRAMVVTVEPHTTDIGVEVLKSGGNAIDAAVAVGFALAVTHPSAGNLGGGGFLLARFADGRTTFLDFRERAPASAYRDMYLDASGKPTEDSLTGYRASGVPGTVRGLEFAHRKYGRRSWADLVAPSVALASKGFPVSYGLATSLKAAGRLEKFEESKRIFLKNGEYFEMDDILAQPELASTLGRIQKLGGKDFYEGETARLLAADMSAHGGHITLEDLKNYAVVERKPLTGAYGRYEVITAPPPSSGGLGILQMLGVLEGTGYAKSGAGSAASIHTMAEAMRHYFADRSEFLGDPDFVRTPISRLLDPKYIAAIRKSIDPAKATASVDVRPGKAGPGESTETTHYTIADQEGNVVAVTYTLNSGFGSGVTVAKLGFILNNEMDDFATKPGEPNAYGLVQGEANAIQPGKHPLSSMTPTIVTRDGKFYLALGSPGGPTIINTVLQVIVNVLDFKMDLQRAVDWPRIHHQWLPDELRMESGFSPDTIELLKARGHKIKMAASQGEVAAILWDGKWLQGAADGRTEGTAKGF
ncbi:MAG TPA: gamma-glutamyltransferase [Bryobacteraceae bacterium]|nr:gamma-glutamyltransferase [Bryobacteraceae bacterium]